jgi:ergothioneine biosynthesis protein EgtB
LKRNEAAHMSQHRSIMQSPLTLRDTLSARFAEVRADTLSLTVSLSAEDQCIQSMPDASPTKWHLAHTSWFFESMLLRPHLPGYQAFDERFFYLFNSYYEALGPRHPRPQRGLLTRPALQEVLAYRAHVDQGMQVFMAQAGDEVWCQALPLVILGLNHEQQHQELLLTDILHAFSCNPLLPPVRPAVVSNALRLATPADSVQSPLHWIAMPERIVEIGHMDATAHVNAAASSATFAFDNETPRHRRLLPAHEMADRLVTCGEYAEFVEDGGYERPEFWLSDGWAMVQANQWRAPVYWLAPGDARVPSADWQVFGLNGVRPLAFLEPVSHLSFFEAAAYAEWAGARLPTEFEWEAACAAAGITQMTGHVWQWTRSSYDPYPGFRPPTGAVGEYNGKFMVSQMVLRGGSLATPSGHTRPTYRNFFPPGARWQFSGLRLARDIAPN